MKIILDDLSSGDVIQLLEEHLADMYATSPPESVHALDVERLKSPNITFFSAWLNEHLQGCLAINKLSDSHLELKSMRTATQARNSGVASQLLLHVVNYATEQGYKRISLETGSQDYFKAARNLYEKFGFEYCQPFAEYKEDINSQFMTKHL